MPTIKGITAHHELLPAGRNPFSQPPPKTISIAPIRKVSPPTIIDAETVIPDLSLSEWPVVGPGGDLQATQSARERGWTREPDSYTPFFWRRALTAYAHQMLTGTPFFSTGVRLNLVA